MTHRGAKGNKKGNKAAAYYILAYIILRQIQKNIAVML